MTPVKVSWGDGYTEATLDVDGNIMEIGSKKYDTLMTEPSSDNWGIATKLVEGSLIP